VIKNRIEASTRLPIVREPGQDERVYVPWGERVALDGVTSTLDSAQLATGGAPEPDSSAASTEWSTPKDEGPGELTGPASRAAGALYRGVRRLPTSG
jgi:hypothetical protein